MSHDFNIQHDGEKVTIDAYVLETRPNDQYSSLGANMPVGTVVLPDSAPELAGLDEWLTFPSVVNELPHPDLPVEVMVGVILLASALDAFIAHKAD